MIIQCLELKILIEKAEFLFENLEFHPIIFHIPVLVPDLAPLAS